MKPKLFDLYYEEDLKQLKLYGKLLLNDYVFVANKVKAPIYHHDIWNDVSNGRSFLFKLHAFSPISYLLSLYERTNEQSYLYKAFWYYKEWVLHHSKDTVMCIHDHVTALRLMVISKLFILIQDHEDLESSTMMDVMSEHCQLLLEPSFYRKQHNHGLDQDLALFIASTVLYHYKRNKIYKNNVNVAINRLEFQIDYLIQNDGSYTEHAPKYAIHVYQRLQNFYIFLSTTSNQRKLKRLIKQKLSRLHTYITIILQPNHVIPPISDSDPLPINWNQFKDTTGQAISERIQFSTIIRNILKLSNRRSNNSQHTNIKSDYFFKDGNIVISSNQNIKGATPLKVWFYSAFNTRVHKHHDDLAFILYYKDRLIFLDSGKYNYNYKDPIRKSVVSNYGHNTVRLNNNDTSLSKQHLTRSQLSQFILRERVMFTSGQHTLYEGSIHKRMLLFVKPYTLLVIDDVISEESTHIEQVYNLTPTLDYSYDEDIVYGYEKNACVFKMNPIFTNQSMKLSHYKGHKNPYIGWYSHAPNQIKSCDSFIYNTYSNHFKCVTAITFTEKKREHIKVMRWDERELVIHLSDNYYTIHLDDLKETLTIKHASN